MEEKSYLQLQGQRMPLTDENLDELLIYPEEKMSKIGNKFTVTVPNCSLAKKCLAAWKNKLKQRKDAIIEQNIKFVEGWLRKNERQYITDCALKHLPMTGSQDRKIMRDVRRRESR